MPATTLSPWRFILAQFVEARRIARNAPASDEGDRTRRATKIAFKVQPDYPTPNSYAPSWNVAPTDNLPIVRYNEKTIQA
jgi:hypothetical protein